MCHDALVLWSFGVTAVCVFPFVASPRSAWRSLWMGAVLLVALVGLSACQNRDPVTIGVLLPLDGPGSSVGLEVRDGMLLAIEQINDRGGLNGRNLALTVEGAGTTAAETAAAVERLAAQDPLMIVSATSRVSIDALPTVTRLERLMFAVVASAIELTDAGEWVYRYWPLPEDEVPGMLALLDMDPGDRVGAAYLDDPYGQSVHRALAVALEDRGVELVGRPFPLATQDFDDVVLTLADTGSFVAIGFDVHLRAILRALDQADYPGAVISNTAAALPAVTQMSEADGLFVAAPAIYNRAFSFASETAKNYEDRFDKTFNHYAANGYDLMTLVAGAIVEQPMEQASLKSFLERGFVYSGLFGTVSLQPGESDISFPLFRAQIQNGALAYQ